MDWGRSSGRIGRRIGEIWHRCTRIRIPWFSAGRLSWNGDRCWFRHNRNRLEWSGEASERCGVTLFIGIAGRAFAHYRLFGYINYLTASVNATFLCRAFGIRSTSDSLNASVLWIDHKSGRAEFADGLMLFNVARPVFWAGGILARITALEVDAGHGGWAASIA